jgi:hypothetical protein
MNNTISVVGTVHHETVKFKWEDLYNRLCELKPDIILMEFPLEIEPEIMQWMQNNWEKLISVESTAVLKYLEQHAIPVRPYDIRGRNDYYIKTRFFEQEEAFGDAYDAYFKQPSPHPDAVFLNRLLTRVAKHYGFNGDRGDRTIEQINSADCDRAMETYLSISRTLLMEIVNTVPELVSFREGLIRRHNHHLKREKAMVKNILDYNKQYENKHLVVLCGYCHRFALVRMLSRKQKSDNFILKA